MVDSLDPVDNDDAKAIKLPHQIIRASAGTGKTFALSNRYLQLLFSGVQCHSILATTFSRKGAGEILDRIIRRLSDAALSDDAAANLAGEIGMPIDRPLAASTLHQLLGNLHRLEVSTLDSFFNRVAKAFSLEIGLPPTWDIVDEQKIATLEDESIQQVLQEDSVLDLLHMLAKGEASRRVASMIRDTVRNAYLIFRESGPEAWDRLEPQGFQLSDDQIDGLLNEAHALIPEKKGLVKAWGKFVETLEASDWAGLLGVTAFKNFVQGNPRFGRTNLTPEMLSIFNRLLPHCQDFISKQIIHSNRSTSNLLQPFGETLERSKDLTGSLRFEDVTERLQAFVKVWDTDQFSFRLDNQIRHLLLDEFQDTSPSQWNVLEPFAKKVVAETDGSRSFFCVGDMKQAIFGWRGGVAEIFDVVDETLDNLAASPPLAKSYRSSQVVIDLVNDVFENVKDYSCDDELIDEAVHDWPKWFSKHTTARDDLKGYVTLEMAPECDQKAKSIEGRKDQLRNQNLTKTTVQRIRQLVRELPADKTIGVLVRRNKEVTELISQLREKGVPASEEGGSLLTDSAAVELVLSAIRMADHPGDSLARFHLSHSPLAETFGLEPESDANAKENAAAARIGAAKLRKQLIDDGYGPAVESLARQLVDDCTKRETERLQQLVRAAYDRPVDVLKELRPGSFVEYIREEVKVSGQNSANVRVMTIHKSKGLEFDVVVLPYQLSSRGWSGQTPSVVVGRQSPTAPIDTASRYVGEDRRALLPESFQKLFEDERQQSVSEAMCVLYVMLTRAVHAVHILVSHGAKADHKSPAGVLVSTLTDGDRAEGMLHEKGDPKWYEDDGDDTAAVDEAADPHQLDTFYLPGKVQLKPAVVSKQVASQRGLPKILPSLVSEGDQVDLSQAFQSWGNLASLERGRILHGCFEKLIWADENLPTADQLETFLRSLAPTVADFKSYIDDFYGLLDKPKIKNLFSRRGYETTYMGLAMADDDQVAIEPNRVEVRTERRFAVATEAGFLQGVIDRMVLIYRGDQLIGADIIDLKTEHFKSTQLHDHINRHRPQLQAYRTAAATFLRLPVDRISTRLVFIDSGQIVNLHAIEGSIDFSPKKKATGKSSASKTPAVKKPVKKKPVEKEPVEEEPVVKKSVAKEPVKKAPVEKKPVEKDPVEREPVQVKPVAENKIEVEVVDDRSSNEGLEQASKDQASENPVPPVAVKKSSKKPIKKSSKKEPADKPVAKLDPMAPKQKTLWD